jgi:hypothetical protein
MRKSYLSARFKNRFISALFLLIIAAPLQSTLLAQSLSADGTVPVIERDDMIIAPAPDMGEICTLDPTYTDAHFYIKSEEMTAKWVSDVRSAEFEIDYVENCGTQTWPQQAQEAFEYGLSIWESHLESSVPIRIRADWVSLQCDSNGCTLGSAGPTRIVQLTGAEPNTWYTIAQASAMTGQDIVESIEDEEHDIRISMNCNFDNWYFGTDASTPTGLVDFVTVVLHEVGHGIGFIGSMNADNDSESGSYGFGSANLPMIYDRFTEDGAGVPLLNTSSYSNPSNNLYQALTGQRGGVFFTGINAQSVNAGVSVPLFAPSPWNSGSSYSHVNQSTYTQTENALMRPQVENAFAIHTPGPVFCGMLADWGWPLGGSCLELVGAEALIAVNELSLDFGVTNINSPVERTFVISNDESAEDPLNYSISIENRNYTVVPADLASSRVDPGASVTITIRYNPLSDRIHTAEAIISHNAINASSPIFLSLNGESLKEDEVARLEQNYPNPFNPNTTIPYILPETSNVRLDVYNISGQLVQTLVNGEQPEGRYEISLDGSGLSSGVYLFRLMVNNFADTKKFMLIK